jgi:hypothetical protein
MSVGYIIIVSVIIVLVILGIYFFVTRMMDYGKMVDKAKSTISQFPLIPLCGDQSKTSDAASCYVDRMIHEYGFSRTRDLILNNSGWDASVVAYIVSVAADCQGKCKKSS